MQDRLPEPFIPATAGTGGYGSTAGLNRLPAVRQCCRVVGHPAQYDAEVISVRRQQHVVCTQWLLGPCVPPWVWMSIRPLMDTRPPGVSLEQIVLRVKCDTWFR
jgi:hypothetical protein